jgi:hypothetical protein
MPKQSRQDLIEENEKLLDALEDARDVIGDILDEYGPEEDAEEPE